MCRKKNKTYLLAELYTFHECGLIFVCLFVCFYMPDFIIKSPGLWWLPSSCMAAHHTIFQSMTQTNLTSLIGLPDIQSNMKFLHDLIWGLQLYKGNTYIQLAGTCKSARTFKCTFIHSHARLLNHARVPPQHAHRLSPCECIVGNLPSGGGWPCLPI